MGFRAKLDKLFPKGFHLTDEEIIEDLQHKVLGQTDDCIIPHVDVHEQDEAWELVSMINGMWNWKLKEWCFIRTLKGKYKNGKRQCRTTRSGYWKVTGKERKIRNDETNEVTGTKKTLVFYTGRVPHGKRTNWVMHEYHLTQKYLVKHGKQDQMSYVGCRLRRKKDKKGASCSSSESDQADDSTSISNSSNFTMGSGVAQDDDPISTSDSPGNAATDQSSAVVVEDGSYSSNNVVTETGIADTAGNKDMQSENYRSLGQESIQFDFNYADSFSRSESFNDLEMGSRGGLIDDEDDDEVWRRFLNWEKLNDLEDGEDKAVLNDVPLP